MYKLFFILPYINLYFLSIFIIFMTVPSVTSFKWIPKAKWLYNWIYNATYGVQYSTVLGNSWQSLTILGNRLFLGSLLLGLRGMCSKYFARCPYTNPRILLRAALRATYKKSFCFTFLRVDVRRGMSNERVEKICTQARDHACRCMLAL